LRRKDGTEEARTFTVGEEDKTVNPFGEEKPPARAKKPPDRKKAEPDPEPSAAVKPLIERLTDPDTEVRKQAAESPRKLTEKTAAPALARRVADDLWNSYDGYDNDASSKWLALRALRALDPDRVTLALRAALRAKTEEVRAWACGPLARQKDPEAVAGARGALGQRRQHRTR